MGIVASVGQNGRNNSADTRIVQGLLNHHAAKLGLAKLDVDGICGPLTIGAIWKYQTQILKAAWADGRIDPGGPTLAALEQGGGSGGGTHAAVRPAVNIVARRQPQTLTAADFRQVQHLVDPLTNVVVDALTGFDYSRAQTMPQNVGGQFMMVGNDQIIITPNCQVVQGVVLDAALLRHEQFHYDAGYATARRFVIDLMNLQAPSLADFLARYQDLERLHFRRRWELLNKRYDVDTHHGTNARYQGIWLQRMAACLATPNAETIGGFYL